MLYYNGGFTSGAIQESDEEKPGVIIDNDPDGNLVGMEILDASKRLDNPRSLEYSIREGSSVENSGR